MNLLRESYAAVEARLDASFTHRSKDALFLDVDLFESGACLTINNQYGIDLVFVQSRFAGKSFVDR